VAAHDNEAHGERDGKNETDGSPNQCPEGGRDEDGEGGEPCMTAVDVGLEIISGDEFEERKNAGDENGVLPPVEDGDGEEQGRGGGNRNSDVRDEAADTGQRSEEDGMRKSNEVESGSNDGAEGEVNGELQEEVSRDALGGVAHCLRHEGEIAVSGEPDEAIAEVFTLEENEEGEDDGEECSGEGFDDAAELVETTGGAADFADLERMFRRRADGLLFCLVWRLESSSGGGIDDAEFITDFFEFVLEAADSRIAGAVKCFQLGSDVVAVGGEVVGDGDELSEDRPGSDQEESGETKNYDEGGGGARKAETFELSDNGSEKKCKENGDPEREEKNFSEKEDGDGEYGDGDEPELRQEACVR
jgi:hypothetical protein